MTTTIPSFYRVWFTTIDPLLALMGVLGRVFAPESILEAYSPSYVSPPTIETSLLLDATAGFYAGMMYLQLVLLRTKATDLAVWRHVLASFLLVNLSVLVGLAKALVARQATDWRAWRAEEWTSLGITAGEAIIKTAFLLGIGIRERGKGEKEA